MAKITNWQPENEEFWDKEGKRVAYRNLWVSIPALMLAFAVWQMWSILAVNLNNIGFNYTTDQLFLLAALPGLSGATLRIIYAFVVPVFGGRNWTVISTASLLIPAFMLGNALQDPTTPFSTMAVIAILTGLGGGNFASSMSNIGFFFPKRLQGTALGLNGGLGNLGVSLAQFTIPFVIGIGLFGSLGGTTQTWTDGVVTKQVYLQNGAYVWIIPIIITVIAAYFLMDNLTTVKASVKEQLVIFKRKHMYLLTVLYIMSFGSFIGFSAAFPLLIKNQFPEVNAIQYAFLGPLIGALIRPFGGWLSDKVGGAIVTFIDTFLLIFASLGVIYFINNNSFIGYFSMFMLLFFAAGIANGSIFRMIPSTFNNPKESSAVVGFSSAIAAYGAFFVPKLFGWSIESTGAANTAFYILIVYYVIALFITWNWYIRKR